MSLELDTERALKWKVKLSTETPSLNSPMFWFQNCQWYFELLVRSSSFYTIYFRSKNEEDDFTSLFRIESYIEKGRERICFYEEYIKKKETCVGSFISDDIKTKFNSTEVRTFVFIFYGDIGSRKGENDEESGLRKLSQDTYKLLDEGLFHDVEIQCGDEIFKAHNVILRSRSKVFRKMFEIDKLEKNTGKVQIVDINSNFFKLFLRYSHSGKFPDLSSEIAI